MGGAHRIRVRARVRNITVEELTHNGTVINRIDHNVNRIATPKRPVKHICVGFGSGVRLEVTLTLTLNPKLEQ